MHLPFKKRASSFRHLDMYDKVNTKKPNARASACRRRDLSIGIVCVCASFELTSVGTLFARTIFAAGYTRRRTFRLFLFLLFLLLGVVRVLHF